MPRTRPRSGWLGWPSGVGSLQDDEAVVRLRRLLATPRRQDGLGVFPELLRRLEGGIDLAGVFGRAIVPGIRLHDEIPAAPLDIDERPAVGQIPSDSVVIVPGRGRLDRQRIS